jgi:molybdenum cofactor cytidylyltransferase
MALTGILLAAGSGSRFGGGKLRHPLADGTPIGIAAARRLKGALGNCLAVVRPGDDALAQAFAAEGVAVTVCPGAAQGMGASLAWGVEQTADAEGWIVALADMPFVRIESIRAVAHEVERGAPIAAPVCQGRRGHPVAFARDFYAELVALSGDTGARAVLERHRGEVVLVDCADPGVLADIDRREDLPR